jgi:hypothetical protein
MTMMMAQRRWHRRRGGHTAVPAPPPPPPRAARSQQQQRRRRQQKVSEWPVLSRRDQQLVRPELPSQSSALTAAHPMSWSERV